ncbi:MAG: hypothetical protein IPJ26_10090 [Bacteroidetes bacterium]|nr:hypothetical protein [Bacteroidota bacterium]
MKKLVLVMMIVATTISTLSKVLGQEVQLNWVQILSDENLSYTSGEIKILANGDVILVGTVYNVVEQQSDILLVRLDDKGDEVWSHLFARKMKGQSVVSFPLADFCRVLLLMKWRRRYFILREDDVFTLAKPMDRKLMRAPVNSQVEDGFWF